MTEKFIMILTLALLWGLASGQLFAQYGIRVDTLDVHAVDITQATLPNPPAFSHAMAIGGNVLFTSPELTFEWKVPQIRPIVSVHAEKISSRYRYFVVVYNAGSAKDAIRRVQLMWNWVDVQQAPEFSGLSEVTGWTRLNHSWKGSLAPGAKAEFSLTSDLSPDKAFVIVTGVDMAERHELTTQATERGATVDFVEYMIKTTEQAENFRFRAQ
jgi:hypothetical protein